MGGQPGSGSASCSLGTNMPIDSANTTIVNNPDIEPTHTVAAGAAGTGAGTTQMPEATPTFVNVAQAKMTTEPAV